MVAFEHIPVLLEETIELLNCQPGGVYLDCTLGGGGHAQAILRKIVPSGRLIGIDRDAAAITAAKEKLAPYAESVSLVQANYVELKGVLAGHGIKQVNGVLMDLGVSSPQLDAYERGFTYQREAPLDMRMDTRQEQTAADLVNKLSVKELAQLIWEYGEERWATRIAKYIVEARQEKSITTTTELVDVIKAAIPAAARRSGPHPAKRTFQALRIAVNNELESLRFALTDAIDVLAPGGRICVISFHSLEDRIVKQKFRALAQVCTCPPEAPVCVCGGQPLLKVLTRRPVTAGTDELNSNPRARSAKLRAAQKLPVVLNSQGGE